MHFALTEDQLALQSAVRDLIAGHASLEVARATMEDADGAGDPPGLWQRLVDQGWTAVLVPEDHDGLGLGLLDAAVIARELGAGVVPGPYLPSIVGGEAIRLAGSPEQQKTWLPQLAAGEARFTVALHQPGAAPFEVGDLVVAGGEALTGTVPLVEYAHLADRIVVAARDGAAAPGASAVSLWLVDPSAPGVTITRTPVLDGTTRTATVTLGGVAAERLPGATADVVSDLLARATVLAANDLAGIAREALGRTVDYVRTREQFGKPVGSFQALKHHLADLNVASLMAGHAGWYAAHAVEAGLPDAAIAVSIAKAKASDVARDATAKMIQYHGGIGYTWEHDAHLFFKRAKREEYAYGDAASHRERIARLVIEAGPTVPPGAEPAVAEAVTSAPAAL